MAEAALKIDDAWRSLPDSHARVVSRGKWEPYAYLIQIGDAIVDALDAGGGLIVVNLPPRHGKSEFISYHVPVWFLGLYPEKRVILASYGAELAESFSRRVRNEIRDNPESYSSRVASDSQAVNQWDTTAGGGMTAVGIGSGITGKGGHLIIIDDPVKDWEEADSEVIQKRNVEWFKTTLWTRREPGAVVGVVTTRWHRKDLAGYLLSKEVQDELKTKVVHIKFPALAKAGDPLGRQPGVALCPERFNENALAEIRGVLGSRQFSGLYQQEPVDAEEQKIKPHWIQWFKPHEKPLVHRAYITTDQAFSTKKDADYSVLTVTLVDEHHNLWIWEVTRGRLSVGNFINALFDLVDKTVALDAVGVEVPVGETAENSSIILLIQQEMQKRGVFFLLQPVRSGKDKLSRASKLIGLLSNGKVRMRQGLQAVEDELLNFPTGDHDDIVDTLSMATLVIDAAAPKKTAPPPLPPSGMSA